MLGPVQKLFIFDGHIYQCVNQHGSATYWQGYLCRQFVFNLLHAQGSNCAHNAVLIGCKSNEAILIADCGGSELFCISALPQVRQPVFAADNMGSVWAAL